MVFGRYNGWVALHLKCLRRAPAVIDKAYYNPLSWTARLMICFMSFFPYVKSSTFVFIPQRIVEIISKLSTIKVLHSLS